MVRHENIAEQHEPKSSSGLRENLQKHFKFGFNELCSAPAEIRRDEEDLISGPQSINIGHFEKPTTNQKVIRRGYQSNTFYFTRTG